MSIFYGSFISDDEQYENYKKRIVSIIYLAEQSRKKIISKNPNLDEFIFISYQNIHVAIGRYFNDVDHYKKRHKIVLTHTSKIIAHTIKWISIYPSIFCSVPYHKWELLNNDERTILLNVNYYFIEQVVQYFMDKVNPNISESTYVKIYADLFYYLKTGNYNERMASLWFERIILG